MNIKGLMVGVLLLTGASYAQEVSGEQLFKNNCSQCHANILGVNNDGGYENSYITPAPYVKELVSKLKNETKTKENFTKFITEYIKNPDKRKSLYGKKAIKKFGIMPSLNGALTQAEINRLSNYLYNYNNTKSSQQKVTKAKKHTVSAGEMVFKDNCAQCHANILGVTNDGGYENNYITPAPYVTKLVKKLKNETKTKEEFKTFITEYIKNPDKRKSLYGKKAIKKFGLMPSLEGALTAEQIQQLTNYLYNIK